MEVLRQVLTSEPMSIERLAPELPATVWPVLKRALSKDPAARFASVLEFANALLAAAGCSVPPDAAYNSVPPRAADAVYSSFPARAQYDPSTPPPTSSMSPRSEGRYSGTTPTSEGFKSDVPRVGSAASPDPGEIGRVLLQAREAFGLGETDLALSYVEHAMQIADALGSLGRDRLDADAALIERILQGRVGALSGRLVVRRVPSGPGQLSILPQQAFLLSRLEGQATVDELLDLSPLPRRETLRHLVSMLRKGVIGIE
jgi:hypothetical protein